jgi:hypothetical protein
MALCEIEAGKLKFTVSFGYPERAYAPGFYLLSRAPMPDGRLAIYVYANAATREGLDTLVSIMNSVRGTRK